MKTPVFVEFNGITGTGKTTVARMLICILKDKGYSVTDYNNSLPPVLQSIPLHIKVLFNMRVCVWRLFFCYFRFVHTFAGFKVWREYFSVLKICAFLNYYYKNKESDIIILDEGLFQKFEFLISDKINPDCTQIRQICKLLKVCFGRFVIVNAVISAEQAIERITRRNGNSPYDSLPPEERDAILHAQARCFEKMRLAGTQEPGISIDAACAPEKNAGIIFEHIYESLNHR